MRRRSAEVCLVLGFVLSFIRHVCTLSITVIDEECVYMNMLNSKAIPSLEILLSLIMRFSGSYDHPGIDLIVTCPDGSIVHTIEGTSGDKFSFKAPRSGMYQHCFHDPDSTPESVSFYIHIGHIPNEHGLAKDEHLDPIYVKIAELREGLESVTAKRKYLRARESRHRSSELLMSTETKVARNDF